MLSGKPDRATMSDDLLFRQTFARISTNYVRPVDEKQLKYAGISGLVSSLGDPHTLFLPPVDASEFEMDTSGNFVGVGARLQKDPLGAKMVAVFADGPAHAAGLRAGDVIVAVDGASVAPWPVDKIVDHIRGKENTIVKLTVVSPKSDQRRTATIRRAKVVMPTVEDTYLSSVGMGYITVSQFAENTGEQFDRSLDRMLEKNPKGLIIDMRGNPGGLLETAINMLSKFRENKVVVRMKLRDGRVEEASTDPGLLRDVRCPVAILINEDSASAAEIFSGVMHDYRVAILVGTHSYGKASVQNVFPLRDGSSAKITIARYYLPNGEDIGRKMDDDGQYVSGGLEPDVEAKLDPDDSSIVIGDLATDTQLQKAVKTLQEKSN